LLKKFFGMLQFAYLSLLRVNCVFRWEPVFPLGRRLFLFQHDLADIFISSRFRASVDRR
jgi:hypothetical protein